MNQLTFDFSEKSELKEAAVYIWHDLPPLDQWVKIRQVLPPQAATNINDTWKWLGASLHAFFGNHPDPLPCSGLEESLQQLIQQKSLDYIILSALIFQAERFLRQEVIETGLPITWQKRSDILKIWAFEHCRYGILLHLQPDWESHSEQSRNERLKKIQDYVLGNLREEEFSKLEERWDKEDAKLCRPSLNPEREMPFTYFCIQTFYKYRNQLSAFEPWVNSDPGIPGIGKFRLINGKIKRYPGRGKGKKSK